MVGVASSSRGFLERIYQRPRRERLCEIGETLGLIRSLANGGGIVPSHVDDRHRIARRLETEPYFDA